MIDRIAVKNRIIDITAKHRLSHLGSCLNAIPPLCDVYDEAGGTDPVILSAGHAGLSLYCVLQEMYGHNAEQLLNDHGIHPTYDPGRGIWCSTGSLGCGITIALGYALANRARNTYCIISDGEAAEGSVWETLSLATELNVKNFKVIAILNGFAAYKQVEQGILEARLHAFNPLVKVYKTQGCPELDAIGIHGLAQHYHVITTEQAEALRSA